MPFLIIFVVSIVVGYYSLRRWHKERKSFQLKLPFFSSHKINLKRYRVIKHLQKQMVKVGLLVSLVMGATLMASWGQVILDMTFFQPIIHKKIESTGPGFKANIGITPSVSVKVTRANSSSIIYVPDNYTKIQAAINAANPGDTIFVSSGTYYENVVVNKTVLLIGENKSTTVIDGSNIKDVIYVASNFVLVDNFTIKNGKQLGIRLSDWTSGNIVSNNVLLACHVGIYLHSSSNNTLSSNSITDSHSGIESHWSSNNKIEHNDVTNVSLGIGVWGNPGQENEVIGNRIANSGVGLVVGNLATKDLIKNNIVTNSNVGIDIWSSNYNAFYHNSFINNSLQIRIENSPNNTWDNGYPSGGNYWSDYNGTDLYSGPYQNEAGSDGIGDTPYFIDENNQDNYPLMNPLSSLFQFSHPETIPIHQVHLEAELYFSRGCLLAEFYSYGGLYQGNVTVWNGTTPADVVLSMDIIRPQDNPIERVYLVWREINMTKIQTVTSFTMHRTDLFKRLLYLDGEWPYVSPDERSAIMNEIADIDIQWVYAPS